MNVRLKRVVFVGAGLLAVAVVGFAVAQFAGAQDGEVTTGPPLGLSNRDVLSVCVEGGGGASVGDAEVRAVSDALGSGLDAVGETRPEFTDYKVSRGCPPSVVLAGTPLPPEDRPIFSLWAAVDFREASEASRHRAFVYFVSPAAYAEYFGSDAYFLTTAEYVCHGDFCGPVTGAVHVPEGTDVPTLRESLLDRLNLLPRTPEPGLE